MLTWNLKLGSSNFKTKTVKYLLREAWNHGPDTIVRHPTSLEKHNASFSPKQPPSSHPPKSKTHQEKLKFMENSHLGITLLSLIIFFSLPKSTLSQDPPLTVFEILQKFGLPGGLLPNTVKSYSLSDDGSFTVYLEKECHVEFDYLVNYEKIITGKLGYGSITNLKGIQVQKFFLWLEVDEIKVDLPPSDSIYFQVGWINKKLDADQFKTVHSCRAGVSYGSLGGLWKQFLELFTCFV